MQVLSYNVPNADKYSILLWSPFFFQGIRIRAGMDAILVTKFNSMTTKIFLSTEERLNLILAPLQRMKKKLSHYRQQTEYYGMPTSFIWMLNSTSSPGFNFRPMFTSCSWKKISLTTSARSIAPYPSFNEHTTPWYLTG